jgi:hypothetical protein
VVVLRRSLKLLLSLVDVLLWLNMGMWVRVVSASWEDTNILILYDQKFLKLTTILSHVIRTVMTAERLRSQSHLPHLGVMMLSLSLSHHGIVMLLL